MGTGKSRGTRYTSEQRLEILEYAREHGIQRAARHFKIAGKTIARWKDKPQAQPGDLDSQIEEMKTRLDRTVDALATLKMRRRLKEILEAGK